MMSRHYTLRDSRGEADCDTGKQYVSWCSDQIDEKILFRCFFARKLLILSHVTHSKAARKKLLPHLRY